jgi:hypothetical protein
MKSSGFGFMGLDESCLSYLGRVIAVRPVYGWGWSRLDAPEIHVPNEIDGVPRPFHCRIKDFFYFKNELRGAVGNIEEAGHIYDDLWITFYTRVIGTHNFTDKLPYCNIEIGPDKPVIIEEWYNFTTGEPIVNGYCFVGETLKHIEDSGKIGRKIK